LERDFDQSQQGKRLYCFLSRKLTIAAAVLQQAVAFPNAP
jgi:hypothetical protein